MASAKQRHPHRKLSAILQADVVGYSRLMGENEALTLERLKTHQRELIEPTIEAFHGHIVKLMGDGMLVEFPSVVEAVSCAVTIQQGMAERNKETAESEQIVFRIGINLGDIIVEEDDIFGDGVNIAARLEGLASPGCICISGAVYDAIGNKLPLDYEYLGEQTVKNIVQPVRTYRVQLASGSELEIPEPEGPSNQKSQIRLSIIVIAVIVAVTGTLLWLQPWQQKEEPASEERVVTPLLEIPSIAVLPFDNMSGDPEQEYFSDGISEDIITDLSRLKNLAVIARNSSFTYKGVTAKAEDIGKDLNVNYLLEGSVRRAGDRVRITAQLIDTNNGHHLWAERFDRELTDVFAVQDEITDQIVSALSIQLSGDEQQQLARSSTSNFEAYDLFLLGQRASAQLTDEALSNAAELYREAISIDPSFARAYGALAITLTRHATLGFSDSPLEARERALELARKAVSIDPTSPQALWALGYIYMTRKQFSEAVEVLEKAISVAPNYADGYGLLALINNNLGRAEDAIRLIKKGMELNPYYTFDYPYNLGRAYYALGDYETAVQNLEAAIERNEAFAQSRLYLLASYIQLGRQDDAEWQVTELEIRYPNSSLSHWQTTLPLGDRDLRNRLFSDLHTAGMTD
jgi:TolB-like protein/class 3 adenylate cyclase